MLWSPHALQSWTLEALVEFTHTSIHMRHPLELIWPEVITIRELRVPEELGPLCSLLTLFGLTLGAEAGGS